MISRNAPCWCGSTKKWKKCHYPEESLPSFEEKRQRYLKQYQIYLKTPDQIKGIRRACKVAANILKKCCEFAKIGMTTLELNNYAAKLHKEAGATAAALHYGSPPFPREICISLNDMICHGIADDTPLKEGDILNIDVASIVDGYYGDCSAMVTLGKISEEAKRVVDVSYESLMRSIEVVKPGAYVSEVGRSIEDYALSKGCSVVNEFVGHGVGISFHEAPQVPFHYNNISIPFEEGMTFTIEPMINAGERSAKIDSDNEWEARTIDGKMSAQWEHTLLVTPQGVEILTIPD